MKTKHKEFQTTINKSYRRNYILYIPDFRALRLKPGLVSVRLKNHEGFLTEGTLNNQGGLSGMVKLYRALGLKDGDKITIQVTGKSELTVTPNRPPKLTFRSAKPTVFATKKLKAIHFEAFRPQNLVDWKPKAEVDVYMAFGILENYTEYKYCCGVNAEILKQLGARIGPKPDAILIDRGTDEYLMAEFETTSSIFARQGHSAKDIDILVCWEDDETNRAKLPARVLTLSDKARDAALEILGFDAKEATNH
jgi:hypothetical protein